MDLVFQYFFIVWSTELGAHISGSKCSSKMFVYLERILKLVSIVSDNPWVLFVDGFFPLVLFLLKSFFFYLSTPQYENNRNVLCSPFSLDFKNNAHVVGHIELFELYHTELYVIE